MFDGHVTRIGPPRGRSAKSKTKTDGPPVIPRLAPDPPPKPEYYADIFRRLSDELTRARAQEQDAGLLFEYMHRAIAQAMWIVWECIDGGYLEAKGPLTLQGRRVFHKPYALDQLILAWKLFVVPWLVSVRPGAFKPSAGQYDWPGVKHDAGGRPVGRNGAPVKWIRRVDKATGHPSFKIDQPFALVTDDLAEIDRLRAQAGDWADACTLLHHLLVEQCLESNDGLAEYRPAYWFQIQHGISQSRLSEAVSTGSLQKRSATPGTMDLEGRKVRVLYHVSQALKHCQPQRLKRRRSHRSKS